MPDLYSTVEPVIRTGLEPRKIDLKREVDLSDRPRAAKFAKIVSALANTAGGTAYVVVGVKDNKDRHTDQPADYVVGFEPDHADVFQRQLQQALEQFVEPIPTVGFHLVTHPETGRMLGVIEIERSFNRPHRVRRDSGEVEQGIYLRRGGELFQATADEIEAMRQASLDSRLVLNFARKFTDGQLRELRTSLGALPEVIDAPGMPVQFNDNEPLALQVLVTLDGLGLTLEEWASLRFVVNLPGIVSAAAALTAEIHGRSGNFPHIIRMVRQADDGYHVTEIVKLQNIRDDARKRSTRL